MSMLRYSCPLLVFCSASWRLEPPGAPELQVADPRRMMESTTQGLNVGYIQIESCEFNHILVKLKTEETMMR